jgi:hypothetical protein
MLAAGGAGLFGSSRGERRLVSGSHGYLAAE